MAFCALLDKIEGKNITINKTDEYFQMYINSKEEVYRLAVELMKKGLEKQSSALEETHEEIDRLMNALIPKLNETIQSLK